MAYLIIVTIFTLIIISRFIINDRLSKIIIMMYLIWWGIWLGLSTFNFYDLFSVQTSTYLLLILNVVMFYIGFLFCGEFRDKDKINFNKKYINDKVSKHFGFLKLLIIIVFILLYYWLRYRNVVYSGISSNNRMERFSAGNVFSSAPEILAYNYFISSFMFAAIIILAYMIIYGEFKNITFILLALSIFFYAGIGSGRGSVMDVLIAMTLIFSIRKIDLRKKISINNLIVKTGKAKKNRLWSILFIGLIVLIIFVYSSWLTASRMGHTKFNIESIEIGWNEFFKQGIIYYTGPFRALDYGLKVYPQSVGYLFGRGTFAGVDEIINMAFRIIGVKYSSANEIVGGLLQNNYIQIGDAQIFNYAYTSVMIHYFDLGIWGVIIFPFFYGFFIRKAIFLYERKPMLPTLIIVVFLFNTMINSVFKWGLQSPASNIVLVGCYFWYKYNKSYKENKYISDINLKINKKEHNNEYIMANQYSTSRSK